MRLLIALAAMILLGPAQAAEIKEMEIEGIPYTLYLDAETSECGPLKFNEGCTVIPREGKPRMYLGSNAPQWVVEHEQAHILGMTHTQWRNTPAGVCCFVRWGGTSKKYARGDTLCNINGTEYIHHI